jgi:hypothetical protein
MPRTASRNGHDSDTATARRRTTSRRSHSLAAETNRHIIRPAKRAVNSASRSISRSVSGLPGWVPWAAVGVGACALIYGLFQIDAVRTFASDIGDTVSDFVGSDDFEEDFGDEGGEYESGDYGSRGADYSAGGL